MFISGNDDEEICCPLNDFGHCLRHQCAAFRWDTGPVFVPELDQDGEPVLDDLGEMLGETDFNHPARVGHCGLAGATRR
jgi:hypothetical protein